MTKRAIFLGAAFFLVAVFPARAAWFCGMRKNVSCLIEAIDEGNLSRVVKNLRAGVDPNGEADGVTPIAAAIKAKNLSAVSELLKHSVDLEKKACASGNALFCALDRFPPAMESLLRAGANPDATNPRGDLILVRAVTGNNALKYQLAKTLLKHGADVNKRDGNGNTPLAAVLKWGRPADVMRFLLKHGANPNVRVDGKTPLFAYAVLNAGNLKKAALLKKFGANVDALDAAGRTVLIRALEKGKSTDTIDFLLKNGTDANARSADGGTPLNAAIEADAPTVLLNKLVAAGAKVDAVDAKGRTALIRALEKGKTTETIDFLLKKGADVNARAANRQTPLLAAVKARAPDAVLNKLIAAGADVNAADADGNSAVAHTVKTRETVTRKLNRLDLLRKHGADMSAVSGKGETIADLLRAGNKDVIADGRYWELLKKVSAGN